MSYHQKHVEGDLYFDFGRIPRWNCPVAGKHQPQLLLPERPRTSAGAAAAPPAFRTPPAAPVRGAVHTPPAVPAAPRPVATPKQAWFIPPVQCNEPEDGVFFAQVKWSFNRGVILLVCSRGLNG